MLKQAKNSKQRRAKEKNQPTVTFPKFELDLHWDFSKQESMPHCVRSLCLKAGTSLTACTWSHSLSEDGTEICTRVRAKQYLRSRRLPGFSPRPLCCFLQAGTVNSLC